MGWVKNTGMLVLVTVAMALPVTGWAGCAPQARALASKFMNDYLKYRNDQWATRTSEGPGHWLRRNKSVTAHFSNAYQKMVDDASKGGPESGLDFDPIVNAQDTPDKGFVVDSCAAPGYVIVRGVDWETFKVTVKVIKTPAGWRVDGAGVINIPEEKQAPSK